MYKSVVLFFVVMLSSVCHGQETCHNFSMVSFLEGEKITDFYIKIYHKEKVLILYDNDTGKICIKDNVFNKSDSLSVHYNFQQKSIPKDYDFTNPMPFKTESELDEIVLNSKKYYTEIGPAKGKTIPHTLGNNQISVLSFQIDSLSSGMNVDQIKFHFRGAGLFISTRSYEAQFKVLIYHSLDSNFEKMTQLVNDNTSHVVDLRGRGWLDVDLSELEIKIPEKGYIMYGLQCVNGSLNISQNKVNKNKDLYSTNLLFYKFRKPFISINKSGYIPRIKLQLFSYE